MAQAINIQLHTQIKKHQVSRYLYSHFAEHLGRCIYGGIWVGPGSKIETIDGIRKDAADALKKLKLPALRWPGGCFADNYHWMDGIGPREKRPKRINLWWKQAESNQFGTDEFMRFCQLIETEPYICLNIGSGTVEEARSWVEYCNCDQSTTLAEMRRENGHAEPYDVQFWGIGNENWGCGGQMRPEYYADLYRRFSTFVRKTAGDRAKLIACGSHPGIDNWDEKFLAAMKGAYALVDYLALHFYSGQGSSDIHFSDDEYYGLLEAVDGMDQYLGRAIALARAFSTPEHKIGIILDEWGTWFKEATVSAGLYQQNTMRDALFTAASFHCFHNHGQGLFMTNMAQTVNVLQSLVLTKGSRSVLTPTYHIYDMFRSHRDGILISTDVASPPVKASRAGNRAALSVSATWQEKENLLFVSIINLDLEQDFSVNLKFGDNSNWQIRQIKQLAADDIRAHNSFEVPEKLVPVEIKATNANVAIPAMSVTTLRLQPGM
ncbi:alpha-N-arabinofuranosidase [candidate division KSB1 bacterium]|nr:alpha-N-arabinofuranosidase [candidate division KSB1 bacterium]